MLKHFSYGYHDSGYIRHYLFSSHFMDFKSLSCFGNHVSNEELWNLQTYDVKEYYCVHSAYTDVLQFYILFSSPRWWEPFVRKYHQQPVREGTYPWKYWTYAQIWMQPYILRCLLERFLDARINKYEKHFANMAWRLGSIRSFSGKGEICNGVIPRP